jgi:enoyl-[acyl-carrier protein] reductase II
VAAGADVLIAQAGEAGGHARWISTMACAPRALRTTLTDQLEHDPSHVDAEQVRAQFLADVRRGGGHDNLPFTGQSAELIHDIPAVSDLMARLVADAEHALRGAAAQITPANRA